MTIKDIRAERSKIQKHMRQDLLGTGMKGLVNRVKKPLNILTLCVGVIFISFSVAAFSTPDTAWLFAGAALLVFALTSGYLGFLCSFIAAFTSFAFFPLADACVAMFSGGISADDQSFLQSYIPLFIILPVIFIITLLLRKKLYEKPTYSGFKAADGKVCIADVLLEELYPIDGFGTLIKVKYTFQSKPQPNTVASKFVKFARYCDNKGFIPVGASFNENTASQEAEFFIYAQSEDDRKTILHFFDDDPMPMDSECLCDTEWSVYKNEVLPDDITVQHEYNRRFSETLERKGFDTAQTKKLAYVVAFNDEASARKCLENAPDNGLIPTKTEGEDIKHDKVAKKDLYFITLLLESRLGIERLNINSQNVIEYVKKFNGSLRHWMFSQAN